MSNAKASPQTLDDLRAIRGDEARIEAAHAYLKRVDECAVEARTLRDEAVRSLIRVHGKSKAARLSGLALSTVKSIGWGVRKRT